MHAVCLTLEVVLINMCRSPLLRHLPIVRYRLRKAYLLRGEGALPTDSSLRLMIVCEQPQLLAHPFIQDILHGLRLTLDQVNVINCDRLQRMMTEPTYAGWLIGVDVDTVFNGICLRTPPLYELIDDAAARRHFWQQVCHHDDYFFSDV